MRQNIRGRRVFMMRRSTDHGKPFNCGDVVWLYSPAVARGKSSKISPSVEGSIQSRRACGRMHI